MAEITNKAIVGVALASAALFAVVFITALSFAWRNTTRPADVADLVIQVDKKVTTLQTEIKELIKINNLKPPSDQ